MAQLHAKVVFEEGSNPQFLQLSGEHYYKVLDAVHQVLKPNTYFEVGTRRAGTLTLARCRSIAVDPQFILSGDVLGGKPSLHLYQQTSDAFFRDFYPAAILGGPIDMAFLDGMHLFEFLLRDFINTERYCRPNSVIVLHDCAPCDPYIATRTASDPIRAKSRNPSWWAGDVWKILPAIRRHRPDLRIYVTDAAPTGLVFVTNLDPTSTALEQNYNGILDTMMDETLDSYGFAKFVEECSFIPVSEFTDTTRYQQYLRG